jgi:hypothetical protein
MASNNVLWELTKNYNSYLTTKANKVFSKDPFNLTNKNIFKYSGIEFLPSPFLMSLKTADIENKWVNNLCDDGVSGVAHERSIGLNVDLEKTEKGYKRHFNIDMKRKKRYASAKNVMPEKNTSRFITRNTVKRDVNATATVFIITYN